MRAPPFDADLPMPPWGGAPVLRLRGAVEARRCSDWSRSILAARADWTVDFGGEQFCLGRAFYTHLETDRTEDYFAHAGQSDRTVEKHVPGLQTTMRTWVERAVGGRVMARPGWCGAGVHIFPAESPVARRGGVVHFDTQGLPDRHVAQRRQALSFVLMIQRPRVGGGLRLWPALYEGADHPDPATLAAGGDSVVESNAGDALLFDSYRLHQIQSFSGRRDRISATLHAAEIDRGLWETWF